MTWREQFGHVNTIEKLEFFGSCEGAPFKFLRVSSNPERIAAYAELLYHICKSAQVGALRSVDLLPCFYFIYRVKNKHPSDQEVS